MSRRLGLWSAADISALKVLICGTCLDQLLIAIRSLIILCNHIRSRTRLIAIMNLIASLAIIYTSLYNHRLSEYELSLPPHRHTTPCPEKKETKMFSVISPTKLGQLS